MKEPTKYPKSTDQISAGIWSVNETGFTGFEVDQCKHSFGHNSVDLQRIVTKFGQVNLPVKNFHMQIWLLNLVTITTKKGVHNYVVLRSIEAKLGRFYLHSNKNLCKFGYHDWLPWKYGNHGNSK